MADRRIPASAAGLVLAAMAAGPAAGADGKALYAEICQACHQEGGKGALGVAPPVASRLVKAAARQAKDYVPLVLLNGLNGAIEIEGQTFQSVMPAQAHLSDADLAAVATYVYGVLNGERGAKVDAKAVAALRATPKSAPELLDLRKRISP
ncbi:c-type cytochrome [Prosthecomicrobium sp. N25]|uniref:c-type cytochrome n=1 Tax=Prosthecomicrobium sp. N25 TaxID=3129254 RepID=UPI003076F123